jgi:molybdopterin/thiamine biosynthesis adenylyltransferase
MYLNINKILSKADEQRVLDNSYKPVFLNPKLENDSIKINQLLEVESVVVHNEIRVQLKELIKCKNPSRTFSELEIENEINKKTGGNSINEYGVWIYYPWSKKLIHILDEQEFIEVRTSRNQYKITIAEREILAKKKIGVIGLSVGQSVSVTLAMERVCGELRLADFDTLELTNLNRIRTGLQNLGLSKCISVAREIAEIDPFISVKCFTDGLNEENMDSFFLDGGKLDLLVEESDGLDIKILSRYKAKELKIPVIMEASDKCMLDIERFDLNPERPILHGLLENLDVAKLKTLKTNEEKIPYMLNIVGIDTISTRAKASMIEIGETITTWPQLASAVTLGGGVTADVSRRLLLNYYTGSGRFYIDIEDIIKNDNLKSEPDNFQFTNNFFASEENEVKKFIETDFQKCSDDAINLEKNQIVEIVADATKAPSGGNAQPWIWYSRGKKLYLLQDVFRSSPLLDFDRMASRIALGAAIENLILSAHAKNINLKVNYFPNKADENLLASFEFFDSNFSSTQIEKKIDSDLYPLIEKRLTNRNIEKREELPFLDLEELKKVAGEIEGCELKLITDQIGIDSVGSIIAEIEKLRIMHPEGHKNFLDEIRWTPEENLNTKDGIDIETCDLTVAELTGFKIAKDKKVIDLLNSWERGAAFEKLSKKATSTASALGLVLMPEYSKISVVNGGRAMEKVWLKANGLGIAFQPQSPVTFLFARLINGNGIGLDSKMIERLPVLRKSFKEIWEIESDNLGEIFLFRLFKGTKPVVNSLRRDINDVLKFV